MSEDKKSRVLSLGWIVGGSTDANRPWDDAIEELDIRIEKAAMNIEAPLNLNVVFHIPGNMLKPEFDGIRTGSFSKARALLMVQVALPEAAPADAMGYLKSIVYDAIDDAEKWSLRRRVKADLSKQRDILKNA
jgi:hypothetical protein